MESVVDATTTIANEYSFAKNSDYQKYQNTQRVTDGNGKIALGSWSKGTLAVTMFSSEGKRFI